jgi:CheY-like chemotaxis protein
MRQSPGKHEEIGITMTATPVERSLILIVEDDEDSREVYKEILSENGFDVDTAASAEEGLRLARERHPNAILMDISLPDMDGWNVTLQLKADPGTMDIPVIIVTAYAFPEDRARAIRVGCDGFLTKPCEPSRVLAEIQRLLAG